ncbi:sarcosine oxidase subunit alpha family protein [Marivibrio halodurans]|uniref:Sarcosine oxidase subunit alpha family protein n=1 Tax=Marivibrio halodurans TaxID=2039722 RepID=A0A8J7SN45_9PROT|nr:sarcosine oxidase subunit alpha family protein [Marivibrio halodurans]MBP5857793.1 sarcosine oxidase subunit alpha family protein [Marivibrio halodurans]
MSQSYRIEGKGRIDRSKPIRFTWNGRSYQGYQGDTLASALLANGVRLVGRSFKYHRPRGIMTAGSEEPNAVVQLEEGARTEPNTRATMAELYDGLTANAQNCWPSVEFDVGALNAKLSRFFPAGFYYKTFMWPAALWEPLYEKIIRRAAGMGESPEEIDPDSYAQHFAHCDVLIAGGGPAGLSAALAAGRTGARVILADEGAEFGGSLLADTVEIAGKPAADWIAETVAELTAMPEVTLLPRTTVSAYYDHNFLTLTERVTDHMGPRADDSVPRQRFWKVRAKQTILAQGAIERPLLFADNDRPGVMLASAARTYINRYGVLPGREIVVFTGNDSAYPAALDAKAAGARVEIVDLRTDPKGPLVDHARAQGIEIHAGCGITGTRGTKALHGCDVAPLSEDGKSLADEPFSIGCDCIAVAGGWNPTVHLHSQARGKLSWDDTKQCFVPGYCQWPTRSAGAGNGTFDLAGCLDEGLKAGAAAAHEAGFGKGAAPEAPAVELSEEGPARQVWIVPSDVPLGHGKKHFHDHQNDVTAADIHLAAREGYVSVEHLKRYTTTGMGTDQGKTSNVNALAVMADIRNARIPEVGTTTFRPPYVPTTFGAIGGQNRRHLFLQERTTPMHAAHVANGAVFEDVGDWKRPWYFPRDGEDMHEAVQRECRQARETCGLLDASTLGKIDIQGPDAAWFLNMMYTNKWDTLAVGKGRYGVMLNEHGMVIDDGVTTRLAENHFHMTTTTGGAARVLGMLEEWLQTEWPERQVYCTSVTEQWAVCTITGPNAKALMADLTDDIDVDPANFPFLAYRTGTVAGAPARVYRISFTGDLAYEVNVPARHGLAVWTTILERGRKHGLVQYGTETMHVLRAEKGFIIVGQDTDGTVTPMDLGMNWIVSKKKDDFIGKRSHSRSDTAREGRKQLVGIMTEDPNVVLPEGAHLVNQPGKPPIAMEGHVTSSYMSPNVGRSIALGLIKGGRDRIGDTLHAPMMDGKTVHKVTLTEPVFFDKEGKRTNG